MEALFGEMSIPAKFFLAFVIVLGLIGVAAFLMRRFSAGPLSTSGPRGRQPRLAVIDSASVDGRRRLVLIRRDNTEHLIMIGGPTDVVVEQNIIRSGAVSPGREQRSGTAAEALARGLPAVRDLDPTWSQPTDSGPRGARGLDDSEAARPDPLRQDPLRPEPAIRQVRDPLSGDVPIRATRNEPGVRQPPPIPPERFRPDPLAEDFTASAPALTSASAPQEPAFPAVVAPDQRRGPMPQYEPVFPTAAMNDAKRVAPVPPPAAAYEPAFQTEASPEPEWPPAVTPTAREPAPAPPIAIEAKRGPASAPPPQRPTSSDESNLAEMAQRLEAALRRPIKPVEPVPTPAPVVRAVPRAEPAVPPPAARVAAYFESPVTPAPAGREPATAPDPRVAPAAAQSSFESLEEEMASLLGRSTGKP